MRHRGPILLALAGAMLSLRLVSPVETSPNVILITIDTLRADYLGCYGKTGIETPTLDALAADGTRFTRAYCQAPMTPPSHASILTGTYPATHGVRDFTSSGLRQGFPTLAGILKRGGYRTAAFISAYVLDSVWGLGQGFDLYHDRFAPKEFHGTNPGNVQRKAGETIDRVLEWLGGDQRGPYFLWVHLYDPHHDYNPPEPYRSRYARDLYAGEVAYTDRELGRLMGALKTRGDYDRSLIVATSDHGEAFGEHGESEHGFFVYETTIRIPLIIKLPRSSAATTRIVESIVETVDIAPTILQATRTGPATGMQGSGLVSAMLGKPIGASQAVYAETFYPRNTFGWSDLAAYGEGKYKYIEAPRPELYDLVSDPGERENLYARQQAVAGNLRQKLLQLRGRQTPSPARPTTGPDPQRIEALRALGYVAVAVPARIPPGQKGLIDPKDRVHIFNKILLAMQASDAGAMERSNSLLNEVVTEDPDLFIGHYSLGVNKLKAGANEEALRHFSKAGSLNPGFELTEINRASALARLGRVDEAISVLRELLRQNPTRLEAQRQLGLLYSRTKNHTGAMETYRAILAQRSGDAEATKFLGVAEVEAELYEQGMKTLRKAIGLGAADALAHNFLGIALANSGQPREAVAAYQTALTIKKDYHQARLNLSFALLKTGQTTEARKEFALLCQQNAPLCRQYQKYFE